MIPDSHHPTPHIFLPCVFLRPDRLAWIMVPSGCGMSTFVTLSYCCYIACACVFDWFDRLLFLFYSLCSPVWPGCAFPPFKCCCDIWLVSYTMKGWGRWFPYIYLYLSLQYLKSLAVYVKWGVCWFLFSIWYEFSSMEKHSTVELDTICSFAFVFFLPPSVFFVYYQQSI